MHLRPRPLDGGSPTGAAWEMGDDLRGLLRGHGHPRYTHPFPQVAPYNTVEEPPQYSTLPESSGTAKFQGTSMLVETQRKGIWTETISSTKFLQFTLEEFLQLSSEHADSARLGFCTNSWSQAQTGTEVTSSVTDK